YLAVLFVPPLQQFYEIEPLPLVAYPLIAAFVFAWLLSVRWIWRHDVMAQLHARLAKAGQRINFQDRLRSRQVPTHRHADVPSRH
ncbi:MAG TPA: hypothetical protein VFV93_16575, partial [Thermomicrobiales bacterium]|nr:hypothetical protein [Thermomicrobiales bacterium]